MATLAQYPARFAALVKIEHTVFALPFAYIAMLLAAGGWPGAWAVGWVTAAMVGARTCAMAANRVVDRWIDARNPRTAGRHLPRGVLGLIDDWQKLRKRLRFAVEEKAAP